MAEDRSRSHGSSVPKRRASSPETPTPASKRMRSNVMETPNSGRENEDMRLSDSPGPIDANTSVAAEQSADPQELSLPDDPTGLRTQSDSYPTPPLLAATQGMMPNTSRPLKFHLNRRDSLKVHLWDVGRIVMRQNKIRKITADLVRPDTQGQVQLCHTCRDLDLCPSDFAIGTGQSNKEYHKRRKHGSFVGMCVKAYVCRLCRLIIRAIAEHPYARLAEVVEHGQATKGMLNYMDSVCHLSWQVDGRQPEPTSNSHRTRRLCFEWSDRCYETIYVIMVGQRRTLSDARGSEYLGRLLPIQDHHAYERKVDTISKWLDICRTNHDQCRPKDGSQFDELRRSAFFGVIDVEEMRFKPLPPNADYVALSYQWGRKDKTISRFTTRRKNVLNIMERNGLSRYLEQLPTTIADTITLVRDLGLRFLWIDSLCIVQDSREAWDRNATVMDLIYGNATLTVCAADGEDANAGLWALNQSKARTAQVIEYYSSGLKLMARYPCEIYVRQSKWNTRAWTYQERLLSRRCLIFTKGHMYLQCWEVTMSEDVDMETPTKGTCVDDIERARGGSDGYLRKMDSNPVSAYMKNVQLYTDRELTRSEDILSAFEGVGKTLCRDLGAVSIFGLPNSHFDLALLWDPEDAPRRRVPGKHLSFPSWSWCGWDKRRMEYKNHAVKDCLYHLNDWLMSHTWITWYIRDGNGVLRLVWDWKRHPNPTGLQLQETMRGYEVKSEHHRDYYGRKIPCEMLGLERNEFKRTIPDFPVQVRTLDPGVESPIDFQVQDRPVLQFWTWSAYFKMKAEHSSPQGRIFSKRWSIVDFNGDWVGTIVLGKKQFFATDEPQQFIAISEARQFWKEEEEPNGNYSRTDKQWPLYNVLLLGYDDPMPKSQSEDGDEDGSQSVRSATSNDDDHSDLIAYRLGLGKIYQEAFDQAYPTPHQSHRKEWREIVLG